MIESINRCDINDLSDENIKDNLYRVYIDTKDHIREFPRETQEKLARIETILKDYMAKMNTERETDRLKRHRRTQRREEKIRELEKKLLESDLSYDNIDYLRELFDESSSYSDELSEDSRNILQKISMMITSEKQNHRLDDKVDFSTAISIVRDNSATIEEKTQAIAIIASKIGKGKVSDSSRNSERLSQFNRDQQEMSALARRIDANLEKLNAEKAKPNPDKDLIESLSKIISDDTQRFIVVLYHFANVPLHEEAEETIGEDIASRRR